ncbi:MAG: hypothetical protein ABSH02_11700 [Candidatus Sulfotelmatobacter sp.]|jgi:hypothetical protein
MMNYKMQLSPISGAHESHIQLPLTSAQDARFFRSWLVYDSDLDTTRSHGRLNWNMFAGFALMAAVSVGGWFGIALLLQYLLK